MNAPVLSPIRIARYMVICEDAKMLTLLYAAGIRIETLCFDATVRTPTLVALELILVANPRDTTYFKMNVMSAMTKTYLNECVRMILSHQIFDTEEVLEMVKEFTRGITYRTLNQFISYDTISLLEGHETLSLFDLTYARCRQCEVLERLDVLRKKMK